MDAAALEAELRARVRGEVRFDSGSRALYATDASNYRQVPIGVVVPRDAQDVVVAVEACRRFDAPVLPRGGGTSLCGQCCNVAVVLDFSKYMNRVLEIDPDRRIARVQPGVVLDDLREQARAHGLTFAPDPATHTHNTLGGMIGNNSCGPHSVMGGETVHNVIELDILTYDGVRMTVGRADHAGYQAMLAKGGRQAEIARGLRELAQAHGDAIRERFPRIPRRVSGYNLPQLLPENGFDLAKALVGTEGTCVTVLEATVRLLPRPPCRVLLVLGFASIDAAADCVPRVMRAGPIALEGVDDRLVSDMERAHLHQDDIPLLPAGSGWLLAEFGGNSIGEARDNARKLMDVLRSGNQGSHDAGAGEGRDGSASSCRLIEDEDQQARIWKVRESGLGATAHVPEEPLTWEGWEDSSVPPERLGDYLRKLRELLDRHHYRGDFYGHFGQGCVHTRIDFDLRSAGGIAKTLRFLHEAAHLVTDCGGSISGEHGDGQSKAQLLPIMYGEEVVRAFGKFKAIWDPAGRMNPGKVVDPYRIDENLRLGTDYRPVPVHTVMHFGADGGDFGRTTLRCVGVGECRKKSGTMCPSYQATGEEMHSTRGRAHLLFEMLNTERPGGALHPPWREPAVKEALDLCLSCKACKSECPVKVDMASYKAEFLAHWYGVHRRPLAAHVFGRIDRLARWAAHAPRVVNFFGRTEPFAGAAKRLIGVAPERALPSFAPRTFRATFSPARSGAGSRVLLWPDTFNNHFHPHVLHAAAQVLASGPYDVAIPPAGLCCGRPLYEFGFLEHARAYLSRIVEALGDDLRAGTPIVVLEPACASVFKEELPMMLPFDQQARRLSRQVVLLADFVAGREAIALRPMERPALVHAHCHHKGVLGFDAERELLQQRLRLDVKQPDTGCCGMAGSFGFEAHKFDVSIACGERVLLPQVRSWPQDELLVADGYSCREQIHQCTGREALHLAEVLQQALPARA